MGTLLASALIARLRITLLDPSPGTNWLDADLLAELNSAQRVACVIRPELHTTRGAMPLVAGVLQQIPATGTALMRLDQNAASGRPVRLVDSALVDAFSSTWPAATQEVDAQDYMVDGKDRKRFRVLPPNDGTGSVVGLYGVTPAEIAAVGNAITLDDIYELILRHLALAECYASNSKRQDLTKAGFYAGSAAKLLGVNAQSLNAVLPKYGTTPGAA